MNREESIALFERCEAARRDALDAGRDEAEAHEAAKAVWNAWAEPLIAERKALEEAGKWGAEEGYDDEREIWRTIGANAETADLLARAEVDFSSLRFVTRADAGREPQGKNPHSSKTAAVSVTCHEDYATRFSGYHFPGDAGFEGVTFENSARFDNATLAGVARFGGATFRGSATFIGAIFEGGAEFHQAIFERKGTDPYSQTVFNSATFKRRARFSEVTFEGIAQFVHTTFDSAAWFIEATFKGNASFAGATFKSKAWFSFMSNDRPNARIWLGVGLDVGVAFFEGDVKFGFATFEDDVSFDQVTFKGIAEFPTATFAGDAWFSDATFKGDARFGNATFEGVAWFDNATFKGDAWFGLSTFERHVAFENAQFGKKADFTAIDAKRAFDLADARFTAEVPDFTQAHFAEAPRLDNIEVPKVDFCSGARDKDEAARFQALKRLAIQGHDHVREQEFFAGELRCRRSDHPLRFDLMDVGFVDTGRLFFAGLRREAAWSFPYDLVSAYGRSIWRPLLGLAVSIGLAAWGYKSLATACCSASWHHALFLSLKNGLLFLGSGQRKEVDAAYLCLFGVDGSAGSLPAAVGYLGIGQGIVSAIFIFLALLALRNLFKIK